MAAGLSCSWSAVGAACCVVVSRHLPRGVVKRPDVVSEDFLKLALKSPVWMREQRWLVGWLRWVCSWDRLDSTSYALVGGKNVDLSFGTACYWERNRSYISFGLEPSRLLVFVTACCVYIVAAAFSLLDWVKGFLGPGSSFIWYKWQWNTSCYIEEELLDMMYFKKLFPKSLQNWSLLTNSLCVNNRSSLVDVNMFYSILVIDPTKNIKIMNELHWTKRNTLLYKNYISFYSRKEHTVCCKFER